MSAVIEQTELPEDLPSAESDEPQSEETSEEARYGYKADGTPRKRPGRKPGSGSGGGSSKGLESLRKPLEQRLTEYLGAPLIFVSPIAAAVWEERVEQTANSILILASGSVRWRKWVERFVKGSAAGDLGITFVGVATGMMVDAGRVSPDGKVAAFYGIDRIYHQLYGAYTDAQNGGAEERGLYAEVS
jgi:hypothetical protein